MLDQTLDELAGASDGASTWWVLPMGGPGRGHLRPDGALGAATTDAAVWMAAMSTAAGVAEVAAVDLVAGGLSSGADTWAPSRPGDRRRPVRASRRAPP